MGIFVILILGAAFSAWGVYSGKGAVERWRAAAAELGLDYHGASDWTVGEMSGTIQGIRVSVAKIARGSGKNRSTWTRYTLGYPSHGPAVEMEPSGFFSGWKKMLGMKDEDIIVGDAAFDDAVVVRGDNPDEIRRFLSPARRMGALTVLQQFRYGHVSENHISAEVSGVVKETQSIVRHVRRLIDIAVIVSAPNEVDLALAHQADGRLGEAVTALHDINAAHLEFEHPNSFTQLLEAEALMAMSDGFQAKKTLDAVAVGDDDELADWRDVAVAHPIPPTMPTPAEDHATSEPVASGPNLDQQAVIDDLFTSHRQSYETEAYFLETYHGQSVRWTGTVERTREFRYDSVFEGTGQRAVVKIGTRGEGVLVTSTVDAIVHFPSELVLTEDQEITFVGPLVRLDFYMRNLYVAEATLD